MLQENPNQLSGRPNTFLTAPANPKMKKHLLKLRWSTKISDDAQWSGLHSGALVLRKISSYTGCHLTENKSGIHRGPGTPVPPCVWGPPPWAQRPGRSDPRPPASGHKHVFLLPPTHTRDENYWHCVVLAWWGVGGFGKDGAGHRQAGWSQYPPAHSRVQIIPQHGLKSRSSAQNTVLLAAVKWSHQKQSTPPKRKGKS